MKPCLIVVLIILTHLQSFSQKTPQYDLKDFVNQGWNIDECGFDPDAEALVLYKESAYDLILTTSNFSIRTKHTRIVKVLNEKGFEEANLSVRFNPFKLTETVKIDKAVVYNIDENGKVTEQAIAKENIFTTKENNYRATMKIAAPNIQVGSIVHYEYTVNTPYFRNHYYQENIPILKSVMRSSFEQAFQVDLANYIYKNFKRVNSNKGGRAEYYIEVDSVFGLKEEPYGDNFYIYVQRSMLVPRSYNNGQDLTPKLSQVLGNYLEDDNFGRKLKANINNEYEVQRVFSKMTDLKDPYSKAKYLYEYVRDNYVMTEDGDLYFETSLSNVLSKKKGKQVEIAALYYRLLQKAGLTPTLVLATTNEEPPLDLAWPSISNFSTLVIKVEIDGKTYYNNPVFGFVPFDLPPRDVLNTAGLEIMSAASKNATYQIVSIESNNQKNLNNINVVAKLDANGIIDGKVIYFHSDYGKVNAHSSYVKDSVNYYKTFEQTGSMEIAAPRFEHDSTNASLARTYFNFKQPTLLQDQFLMIPTNYFSGFTKNPFTSELRKTAVYFSAPIQTRVNFIIEIDPKWEIESVPQNIKIVMHDKSISYTRRIFHENNRLSIQLDISILKHTYELSEYQDFYEFWKMLFEKLNEQIVFKQKA